MTPAQLNRIGPTIFPQADRWKWKALLSKKIGVHGATMRRWTAGTKKIPEPVGRFITLLAKQPRD